MLWLQLGFGTKTTWLGSGKVDGLGYVVWVKMTTTLQLGELCHHGGNNKYVIRVQEESWSCF